MPARERCESCSWDSFCEITSTGKRNLLILTAVHNQRRNTDRRQHLPHVDFCVHPRERFDRAGARAAPVVVGQQAHRLRIVGADRANDILGLFSGAEEPEIGLELTAVLLVAAPDRIVDGHKNPREGAPQNKGRRPFRIGRREQHAHRRPLREAHECSTLRPRRIHHRPDVVHPRLQGRRACDPVRHARAPLVKNDQSRERCELPQDHSTGLHRPDQLNMRHETRDQNHINRPIPNNLISHTDVAASRIPGLGRHTPSVAARALRCRHLTRSHTRMRQCSGMSPEPGPSFMAFLTRRADPGCRSSKRGCGRGISSRGGERSAGESRTDRPLHPPSTPSTPGRSRARRPCRRCAACSSGLPTRPQRNCEPTDRPRTHRQGSQPRSQSPRVASLRSTS